MKAQYNQLFRFLTAAFMLAIIVLLFGTVPEILAQPALPNKPAAAPIDGGLLFLAAGGGAYAVKKIRERGKS